MQPSNNSKVKALKQPVKNIWLRLWVRTQEGRRAINLLGNYFVKEALLLGDCQLDSQHCYFG